jgi:hypothetical protein
MKTYKLTPVERPDYMKPRIGISAETKKTLKLAKELQALKNQIQYMQETGTKPPDYANMYYKKLNII